MLPTPDRPIFFAHVPKTGGHALGQVIDTMADADRTIDYADIRQFVDQHRDLGPRPSVIRGHVTPLVRPLLPAGTELVTVVREPLTRVRSLFRYLRTRPDDYHHEIITAPGFTLADFVTDERTAARASNDQAHFLGGPLPPRLVERWPELGEVRPDGAKLDVALEVLETATVVGVQERMPETVRALEAAFDWPLDAPPTLNVTTEPVAIDDDLAARIGKANKLDTTLWLHANRLLDRALAAADETTTTRFDRGALTVYDVTGPAPIRGFHARRRRPDGRWSRWTGPEFVSSITVEGGWTEPVVVAVVVAEGIDASTAASSVVVVGDTPVRPEVHPAGSDQVLAAVLDPALLTADRVDVELHTPHVGDWTDPDGEHREVALDVTRIGVAPARLVDSLVRALVA